MRLTNATRRPPCWSTWRRSRGRAVIHVCDRGYAGALWLGLLLAFDLRFIVRWQQGYRLLDATGESRLTWHLIRGKKGWGTRTLWDSRRGKRVEMSVLAVSVAYPAHPEAPLWLVVARSAGRPPWYLLSSEPVTTVEQAWEVVLANAWQEQEEPARCLLRSSLLGPPRTAE